MKHDKGFMIYYLNINSLTQTFGELKSVMNDDLVDMISIGESKLNDCVTDAVIHVQNFKTYPCDVTRAHGLVTYIRSSIIHMRRTDIEIYKSDFQYVVIEVWLRKENGSLFQCISLHQQMLTYLFQNSPIYVTRYNMKVTILY